MCSRRWMMGRGGLKKDTLLASSTLGQDAALCEASGFVWSITLHLV